MRMDNAELSRLWCYQMDCFNSPKDQGLDLWRFQNVPNRNWNILEQVGTFFNLLDWNILEHVGTKTSGLKEDNDDNNNANINLLKRER